MSHSNQPNADDAVLGGQLSPPMTAVVLGGVDGVRQRLSSHAIEQRVAAVVEAQKYGQPGLELQISALQDAAIPVQKAAYLQLYQRSEPQVKQALRNYDAYSLYECLYTLTGHMDGITAVAVSANGDIAVSSSRDATLRVWDLPTREEMMVIHHHSFVYAIAISSDNRTFTAKGRQQMIRAWDIRTGQQIGMDDLPTRHISSVTVSANKHRTSKHLISGSQNTIKIWNLTNGQEVSTLKGHTSLVTAVAVAPRHRLLVSGSEDQTLKVWGIA